MNYIDYTDYMWGELLNYRENANLTIKDLMNNEINKDIKICVQFSEYITLCKKDNTILENALNLIKSLDGEKIFQMNDDMTNYICGIISYKKLKDMVKQETYKQIFKGFEFYLFKWALADWRNCELSLPRLVKYYPQIAKDLFNIN